MRLISWNVNGRLARIVEQVAALVDQNCDFVALQEVKQNSVPIFRERLQHYGFHHVADSFECIADRSLLIGPRRYGELIASRWPIKRLSAPGCNLPWPERLLSVAIRSPQGALQLHTAYIPPGSSNGWRKIETLEGIYQYLAHQTKTPRILCGDFNTPKEEAPDGTVVTWHQNLARWDAGERNILKGLRRFGLSDAFRHQHGYHLQEFSWYTWTKRGRRFDHVFASPTLLKNADCHYLHSLRVPGLSDHSAIVFSFDRSERLPQAVTY